MAALDGPPDRGAQAASGPIAVIDIGSNSVRMVAYDGLGRAPAPIFNERVMCGLGRHLGATGMLHPDAKDRALAALRRFAELTRSMGARLIDAVATAAMREARDGADFLATVKATCGISIRVLAGAEEARLSALGVVAGTPDADGMMGDLGGGSLELVALDAGRLGRRAMLPLGPLVLEDSGDRAAISATIEEALQAIPWMDALLGRTFYAVGGGWRELARLHMAQTRYPLNVLHHYALKLDAAVELTRVISSLGPETLARISGVPRRRLDVLPLTALTLLRILEASRPEQVVFSAYGLREGLVFDRLSPEDQRRDPLIEASRRLAADTGRAGDDADELYQWTAPVVAGDGAVAARLRRAACILSDVAWRGHPDFRSEQAFQQVLSSPYVGIDHPGRVFLALAVRTRYLGERRADHDHPAIATLDETVAHTARTLGLALRLGNALSPWSHTPFQAAALAVEGDQLVLRLTHQGEGLMSDLVRRRFAALGRACGKPTRIETGSDASGEGAAVL